MLASRGDYSIRLAALAGDQQPLDDACPCRVCSRYSRAYLRHLAVTGELSVLRLLSIHNLTYTLRLMAGVRDAIADGRFAAFREEVEAGRESTQSGEGLP